MLLLLGQRDRRGMHRREKNALSDHRRTALPVKRLPLQDQASKWAHLKLDASRQVRFFFTLASSLSDLASRVGFDEDSLRPLDKDAKEHFFPLSQP